AGAPPPDPARAAAEPAPARARDRGVPGASVVGRGGTPPRGCARVRPAVGRARHGGPGRGRAAVAGMERLRIAVLAPVWFAVPPAAALGGAVATPVVHTVHGPLNGVPGELYESVARVAPEVRLISVSLNQRKPKPDLPWLANCPNALDFSIYPCKPHRGDYL